MTGFEPATRHYVAALTSLSYIDKSPAGLRINAEARLSVAGSMGMVSMALRSGLFTTMWRIGL